MFIEKDERLSRSNPPRRAAWDSGGRRRAPRNWFKIVRIILYALVGMLAGLAGLATVALVFDRHATPPTVPSVASPTSQGMDLGSSGSSDLTAAPTAPASSPAIPPSSGVAVTPPVAPPADAPPSQGEPPPDAAALKALEAQIREANAALAGLRNEAAQIRQNLSEVARQHQAAPPATPRASEDKSTDEAWADAEKTVRALAQRAEQRPAPAPAPVAPPAALPPSSPAAAPPAPAQSAASAGIPLALNAAPAPAATEGTRARVFLHYPAGSAGGLQVATDIAQRLLFSDFTYADTRSSTNPPKSWVIRYFYSEDAAAADRLAALLNMSGWTFRVEDATSSPSRPAPGLLDVWIGR